MNIAQILKETKERLATIEKDIKTIEKSSQNITDLCDGLLGNKGKERK